VSLRFEDDLELAFGEFMPPEVGEPTLPFLVVIILLTIWFSEAPFDLHLSILLFAKILSFCVEDDDFCCACGIANVIIGLPLFTVSRC